MVEDYTTERGISVGQHPVPESYVQPADVENSLFPDCASVKAPEALQGQTCGSSSLSS